MKRKPNTPVEPCIYCGSDSPPREKREHVISQAVGSYEQNWTLRCVCDECNGFFSRELELSLGRDSIEALLRIDAGVKPPASAESFLGRHMTFTVVGTEHFDGVLARMLPSPDGGSLLPDVVPQVGLRNPGGEWVYLPETALTQENLRGWFDAQQVEIKIIAEPQDTRRLCDKLSGLGIVFEATVHLRDQSPSDHGPVSINHEFIVSTVHRRAAAKVVFNYGAKVLGPEAMRRPEFDKCRQFVRRGIESSPVAAISEAPILVGPAAESTKTHALGMEWMNDRDALVGLLRVFNHVNYGMALSVGGAAEWRGFKSHHLFDPMSRTITDVTPR